MLFFGCVQSGVTLIGDGVWCKSSISTNGRKRCHDMSYSSSSCNLHHPTLGDGGVRNIYILVEGDRSNSTKKSDSV